jgi:hypothetical protein
MKRTLRQAGIFLLLLLLVTLWRLPYDDYAHRYVQKLREEARKQGIGLTVESTHVGFPPTLTLEDIGVLLPTRPIPVALRVEKLLFDPEFLQLFLLRGAALSEILAYKGRIDSDLRYSLLGGELSLSTKGKGLQLTEHPLLAGFGLKGNLVFDGSLSIPSLKASPAGKTSPERLLLDEGSSRLVLAIDQGEYTGGISIKGLIQIPKARDIRLDVEMLQKKRNVELKSLEFYSSLGSATGGGIGTLSNRGQLEELNIVLSLKLTPEGKAAFGGYLALGAGVPLESASKNWAIQIIKNKSDAHPQFTIRQQWL